MPNEASELHWVLLIGDALPTGVIHYPEHPKLLVARAKAYVSGEMFSCAYRTDKGCAVDWSLVRCYPSGDYVELEIAVIKHCKGSQGSLMIV